MNIVRDSKWWYRKDEDIERNIAGKTIQVVMVRMREKDGSVEFGNVEWLFWGKLNNENRDTEIQESRNQWEVRSKRELTTVDWREIKL